MQKWPSRPCHHPFDSISLGYGEAVVKYVLQVGRIDWSQVPVHMLSSWLAWSSTPCLHNKRWVQKSQSL